MTESEEKSCHDCKSFTVCGFRRKMADLVSDHEYMTGIAYQNQVDFRTGLYAKMAMFCMFFIVGT